MGDVINLRAGLACIAAEALRTLAGQVENGEFGDVTEAAVVFRRAGDEFEFVTTAWPETTASVSTAKLFVIGAELSLPDD